MAHDVIVFHPFELDVGNLRLWRGGTEIRLREKSFQVLLLLVQRAGELVTKDDLLSEVWPDVNVTVGTLTDCVKEIRRALKDDARAPAFVLTRHGYGYEFIADVGVGTRTVWGSLIPTRTPFFTGRRALLDQLRQRFSVATGASLQALVGLGGVGKTQTAIEYACRYRDEYEAVFWSNAESSEAMIIGFRSISKDLHLETGENSVAPEVAVKRWLENHLDWLLILDNVERPSDILPFLPVQPRGHILMTSRVSLLDGFGITRPLKLDTLPVSGSRAFLLSRTAREKPMTAAEKVALDELLKEFDGLPLALEQAGAYILRMGCSFADYWERYRKRGLRTLELFGPVAGSYRGSVATTLSVSFTEVWRLSQAAGLALALSAFLEFDRIAYPLLFKMLREFKLFKELGLNDIGDTADPLVVAEFLEPLARFSLVSLDSESRTYRVHRLVKRIVRESVARQHREEIARGILYCVISESSVTARDIFDQVIFGEELNLEVDDNELRMGTFLSMLEQMADEG